LILLAFNGCVTSPATCPSSTSASICSAEDAASKTLYALGAALQATPGILDALYTAGKITKEQYNSSVPVYNQVLASFNLAVAALSQSVTAGQDPNSVPAYTAALGAFLADKSTIDNLILALGGQPVTQGVTK
jgi:hypothetical protein